VVWTGHEEEDEGDVEGEILWLTVRLEEEEPGLNDTVEEEELRASGAGGS
jgi:hypothetical protein